MAALSWFTNTASNVASKVSNRLPGSDQGAGSPTQPDESTELADRPAAVAAAQAPKAAQAPSWTPQNGPAQQGGPQSQASTAAAPAQVKQFRQAVAPSLTSSPTQALGSLFLGTPDQRTLDPATGKPKEQGVAGLSGVLGGAFSAAAHIPVVGPTLRGVSRGVNDVISHPLAALIDMSNKTTLGGSSPAALLSKSAWVDAWQKSNGVSPGQEAQIGWNNSAPMLGIPSDTFVNPNNPDEVRAHFDKSHVGANLQSGVFDLGTQILTTKAVGVVGKVPAGLRDHPVGATTDLDKVQGSAGFQRLTNQIQDARDNGKGGLQIANLKALKDSPVKAPMAEQLATATPDQVSTILRVGLGDTAVVDQLAQQSQATANRVAQMLSPAEMDYQAAFAPRVNGVEWERRVTQLKAKITNTALADSPEQADQWLQFRGMLTNRTTGDLFGSAPSRIKANMQVAVRSKAKNLNPLAPDEALTTSPDFATTTHRVSWFDMPTRIYQSLTDKPNMALINFGDGTAADSIRSWMNKSSVLTPEYKADVWHRVAAATPGELTALWDKIEKVEVPKALADHYGVDPGSVLNIVATSRGLSRNVASDVASNAYGVIKHPQTGEDNSLFLTHDDEVIAHPVMETQLKAGSYPMFNIRHLETVMNHLDDGTGRLGRVLRMAPAEMENVLQHVYGVWKPLVLLTMHRAYNHVGDDYLRGVTKLGALTTIQNAAGGTANFLRNRGARLTQSKYIGNLQGKYENALDNTMAGREGLRAQYRDQRSRLDAGENIDASVRITPADLEAADRRVLMAKGDLDNLVNNADSVVQPKHRLGDGESYIKNTRVKAVDAFGGPLSNQTRNWTSSGAFFDGLLGDAADREYTNLLTQMQQTGHHVPISPTMKNLPTSKTVPAHATAWTAYINNHLRNSPLAKIYLNPQSTLQDGIDWLKTSPGKRYAHEVVGNGDLDGLANDVFRITHQMLPEPSMRGTVLARPVTKTDLNGWFPNVMERPTVPGEEGLLALGKHPAQNRLMAVTQKLMKLTGTLPDDILVRHPVFNSLSKIHRDDLIKNAASQRGVSVERLVATPSELDALTKAAAQLAHKDLTSLVYDVSRFNDAGSTLRFVSPFFNAWYNAMSSWGKLFKDNPALVVNVAIAKHAIWNNPFVVDASTGQRANDKTALGDLVFVGHMPRKLAVLLGHRDMDALPISVSTMISPTYADSIGNPGFGPLVAIPANQLAKENPSFATSDAYDYISGGRITANSLQSFIPSVATDALKLTGLGGLTGGGDQDRAKAAWAIYQNQKYDYDSGKRSAPPNWADIQKQATYVTALDIFVNRLSPLGFKPATNQQFFVDQYKTLLAADPTTAKQKFADLYGESAMIFTQSLDKNVAGVSATAGAVAAYKRHEGIIKQNPELAAVIIGPDGNGSYNQAALQWEFANGLRKDMTPQEAATQANVDKGYTELAQIKAYETAELQRRGLKSINQKGAEDLKNAHSNWVTGTGDPKSKAYNPDFYASYGSFNQHAYNIRIQGLEKIVADPSLHTNPIRSDIQSLNKYFQIRDQARQYLDGRRSTSLTAKANADVANWFDYQVGLISQDDTKFPALYERYLKNDDLKEP